ncbi:MAG: YcaO-like family protein [Bacteriovoracaceae bacterium]|nr:YcaO-like family protein [Bacteriovoracaceae bacterium]
MGAIQINQDTFAGMGWKIIDRFEEVVKIDGLSIHLSAMAAQNDDGVIVTGSAGDLEKSPKDRARYELFERIATVNASKRSTLNVCDSHGKDTGTANGDEIFTKSASTDWKLSMSNGVAYHSDRHQAMQRAMFELVERDHILRSWFGECVPVKIKELPESIKVVNKLLGDGYDFKAYIFGEEEIIGTNVVTVGIFGYPRKKRLPFMMGFSADSSIETALEGALKESVQRLGFLYGEDVSDLPAFEPTPMFHQDYFLLEENFCRIGKWLEGGNYQGVYFKKKDQDMMFVDLLDSPDMGYLYKVVSNTHVPLIFGKNYKILGKSIEEDLQIHPIA